MSFRQFPTKAVYIQQLSDFPTPVGGIITLPADTTYIILGTVDIGTNRIVVGARSNIRGINNGSSVLTTTNAGALMTITENFKAYDIRFNNNNTSTGTIFDADANTAGGNLPVFHLNSVKILGCSVGTIKNYTSFLAEASLFYNITGGFTFDGTFSSISFHTTAFQTIAGTPTCITVAATCSLLFRFRMQFGSFTLSTGTTGINFSTSASVNSESYNLLNVAFTGAGTYTTGVAYSDNKSIFSNCIGITNSAFIAQAYGTGNVTATTISATNTYVKAAFTGATSGTLEGFSFATNRITYTRSANRRVLIFIIGAMSGGNNNVLGARIAVNGVPLAASEIFVTMPTSAAQTSFSCQAYASLSQNDYIELWVENTSALTNIVVGSMNIAVNSIPA